MSCNSFWILLDAMTLLAPERGDGERERRPSLGTCAARFLSPTPRPPAHSHHVKAMDTSVWSR